MTFGLQGDEGTGGGVVIFADVFENIVDSCLNLNPLKCLIEHFNLRTVI